MASPSTAEPARGSARYHGLWTAPDAQPHCRPSRTPAFPASLQHSCPSCWPELLQNISGVSGNPTGTRQVELSPAVLVLVDNISVDSNAEHFLCRNTGRTSKTNKYGVNISAITSLDITFFLLFYSCYPTPSAQIGLQRNMHLKPKDTQLHHLF